MRWSSFIKRLAEAGSREIHASFWLSQIPSQGSPSSFHDFGQPRSNLRNLSANKAVVVVYFPLSGLGL